MMQIAVFAEGFNTGGGCIPEYDECPYEVPAIDASATVRDFTLATWATVKSQAQPGDWLRLTQSIDVNQAGAILDARGSNAPSGTPDVADGLQGAPITVTCAPGVTIRNRNVTSNSAICVDLKGTVGWNVVDLDVTGGYMCIRAMACTGAGTDKMVIAGNTVKDASQAKISIGGWFEPPDTPTVGFRCYLNDVSGFAAGVSSETSEGIYCGTGTISRAYDDRTRDLYIGYNHLHNLQSDPIEFKNGVSDYVCEGNHIHDIDLTQGTNPVAAINCNYGAQPSGGGVTVPADYSGANGIVRKNRIYRLTTLASRPAINVGIGGVTVEDNAMWSHGDAPGVRLRSEMEFKTDPIVIRGNTMAGGGIQDPGSNRQTAGGATGTLSTVTSTNNIWLGQHTGNYQASSADFIGPIDGDADAGGGPGSGFQLNASSGANNTGDAGGIMTECPNTPPHLGAFPQAVTSGTSSGGSGGGATGGGGTPTGDGEFRIDGTNIKGPDGSNWWGAGMNTVPWHGVGFNYVFEGRDNAGRVDVWEGEPNLDNGVEVYPGGPVSSANLYDVSTSATRLIPDRYYALNGTLTQVAAGFGISQPADHWHQKIMRFNAVPRGANSTPHPDDSIPALMQSAQEAIDAGMVVAMPIHNMTGASAPVPAAFKADPSMNWWEISDQRHSDAARFIDAMCEQFGTDGSGSGQGTANVRAGHMWISLPNEPWAYAPRDSNYDDLITTYIARIRATGAKNVIAVPLARYSQDLGALSEGVYDSLLASLDAAGLADNLIWEWHAYGDDNRSDVAQFSFYNGQTGYDRILAHINEAQSRGFKLWVGEGGIATPRTAGNAGAWQGNEGAWQALWTNTFGTPIAELMSLPIAPWHGCGDNAGYWLYKMCHGPLPHDHSDTSGLGVPVWDIDGSNLNMLTDLGLAHWNLSRNIWSNNT